MPFENKLQNSSDSVTEQEIYMRGKSVRDENYFKIAEKKSKYQSTAVGQTEAAFSMIFGKFVVSQSKMPNTALVNSSCKLMKMSRT